MTIYKTIVNLTHDTATQYEVVRHLGTVVTTEQDVAAEEVPIALEYNGISHTVMLATPADLEDFAIGFSLSEGIIGSADDVYDISSRLEANGVTLSIDIASACFNQLKEKRRSMTGRTGCGLCGADSLATALRLPSMDKKNVAPKGMKVGIAMLTNSLQALSDAQALQQATGATHASALFNASGDLLACREDVGRHNALDKLIGAMQADDLIKQAGFILTSSRASYEMVQKTVSAGVSMLAAVSAPTGLAIRMAEAYSLTLVGFTRQGKFVVYADSQQLIN